MSETCWAHKKWNKIASDIKLVFYSSISIYIFVLFFIFMQGEQKIHSRTYRKWIYTTAHEKNVCEHRTYEVWFLSYGLQTIIDSVQRARLELPCWHCKSQACGTLLSSTTCNWGCFPWFPITHTSVAIARCGFATRIHLWFMHDGAAPHFLLTYRELLYSVFQKNG